MICIPRILMIETPEVTSNVTDTANASHPKRILVADDNRDAADTMGMLLSLSGHEVHVARNGAEALEIAKRVRPDIGIFDIGMPDISGYELAARVRHEAWGQKITLIAVTGWGQDTDKRRAYAAGFNHHLTKPVDPEKLELLFKTP